MSRIHEALKRASQERSSQLSVGKGADLAAITPDVDGPVMSASQETRPTFRGVRESEVGPILRFDDLVKLCTRTEWKPDPGLSLIHRTDDGRIAVERFRTLRSRLYQIAAVRPLRRVLVTSSVPAEGKTFVVTNLAESIACQSDRRVLLIDADLRAPRLHVTLGAPHAPGLTEFLRGEADEYSVIQRGPLANLCFIACGQQVSNPSELLLSDRMKWLLDLVTPVFDWVILDSPPALPVHDASSLADLCDGVLFVVGAGKTSHEVAEKGASEFRDKNLLGVVLNGVEKGVGYGGCYYDYDADQEKPKTSSRAG